MAPEGSETNVRPPLRRSRSSRVRRRATAWFRPRTLKTGLAAAIGVVALALGLLAAIVYSRTASAATDLERSEYARLANDVRSRVDRRAGRDESRLIQVAFSDELYASLGQLAAKPDSTFRPTFVEWFPRQFGDRFIAIYDLSGQPLFRWNDGVGELEQKAVSNGLFRMLDNREVTAGLVRQGEDVFWVAGAPVLPTDYRDGTQPIRGYVVVAQPFRLSVLELVPGDPTGSLTLTSMPPQRQAYPTQVEAVAGGDSVRVRFGLSDVFAEQNSRADLVTGRAGFRALEGRLHFLLGLTLVGIAVLAGAGWRLATRWVVVPVERLATSLRAVHDGQVPTPLGQLSPAPEWRQAVAAVNRLLTNARATQDRYDRAFDAVRDGIWEQDFTSGEWVFSSRFRTLLGHDEATFPNARESVVDALHPDDRDALLSDLQRGSGTGSAVSRAVRLRRGDGAWAWFRVEASVATDHGGTPLRFQGRLVDLTAERAAETRLATLTAERDALRQAQGRFLVALAASARSGTEWADDLDYMGRAQAGDLRHITSPLDLHQLLQEVAAASPERPEVAISPGVPPRVEGDAVLLRRVLETLAGAIATVSRGERPALRAEPGGEEGIRLVVERRGQPLPAAERARLGGLLAGKPSDDATAASLGLRAAGEIVRAGGGTIVLDADGELTAFRVALHLEPVIETFETSAMPEFDEREATFWPAEPEPEPTPAAAEPRIELCADETVVINLDEPAPNGGPPATRGMPAIVAHLRTSPDNPLALQMATVFLKDAPTRLRALEGALDGQEPATAAGLCQGLRGMADLVGAPDFAACCQALETATTLGDEGTARERLAGLGAELSRITELLAPFVPATRAAPVSSRPAIDPATLGRLKASFASDGDGLGTQLVSLFLAETPLRLETMERNALAGDGASLARTAAELKGMCALVGAVPMSDICDTLSRPATEPAALVAVLRAEFERAQRVLEGLLHDRINA